MVWMIAKLRAILVQGVEQMVTVAAAALLLAVVYVDSRRSVASVCVLPVLAVL